jgi:hypothetical protein
MHEVYWRWLRCTLGGYEVVEVCQRRHEVTKVSSKWLRYGLGKSKIYRERAITNRAAKALTILSRSRKPKN